MMAAAGRSPRFRSRRDVGRIFARLLCVLFALIGALPLAGAVLVRSEAVTRWAADETARIVQQELGVRASYRVAVRLWPLEVALSEVDVPASDGGSAFLTADRIAIRPRFFALLAGRLDAGDIELETPRARVVIEDGKLLNLAYRLPERREPTAHDPRAPFSSVAVTDASIDLAIDGIEVRAGPLDLDVFADAGPSFDIGLRAAESQLSRKREVDVKIEGNDDEVRFVSTLAHDEDVLCRLEARVRVEPGSVLVRRLSLLGHADGDARTGTRPACRALDDEQDWSQVSLRISQLRFGHERGRPTLLDGHLVLRAPASLVNRFVRTGPLAGSVGFVGDVHYDGSTTLPELRGKLRGRGIELDRYKLAKHLEADVEIAKDRVLVPRFEMGFADGVVVLTGAKIEPFLPGAPLTAERVDGSDVAFEAMMRDLNVTPNTVVKWDLKKTRVIKIGGTLDPLKIDAEMSGETRDFEVFNRAFHDPSRKHMIGVRGAATVRGKIGVRPLALEFYDTRADFGKSTIFASLVSIGFHNEIKLKVGKGSHVRLEDISPLVDIPMKGEAQLAVEMAGQADAAPLTGEMAIQGFDFGGFPLGDVKSAKVKFKPLVVDLSDVHGKKGRSDYSVPSARLNFDANATLIVDAAVKSDRFDLRDFMAMWLFDKDPRFDPIRGELAVDGRVHYALDGPEDRCGGGSLRVDGTANMQRLDLFEERYDSGQANFDFRWTDRDASYLGFDLNVPSITLRKGQGTLLGSLSVRQGGILRGHIVGTAVPLSKIDSLGTLGLAVEGRVSAVAEVTGTVDALAADTVVRVSPVRVASSTLPASELTVKLVPVRRALKSIGKTRCGQPIPSAFERAEYEADQAQGMFHADGDVFGGQLKLRDLRITRQRSKILRGDVAIAGLDLGTIAELSPSIALTDTKPEGRLSGTLKIEELPLEHAERSRATLRLTEFQLTQAGFRAKLEPGAQPIVIRDGRVDLHGLTLAVKTPRGSEGLFDVQGSVDGLGRSPQVDAVMALRPTDLSAFAALFPRAERVKGTLDGKLQVKGPASALRYRGGFALRRGEVFVRSLPAPITDLELAINLDNDEVRISRGSARMGAGTLSVSGSAPLRGFELGAARAMIKARSLSVPLNEGIKATIDSDLVATWKPASDSAGERPLPSVTGDVTLKNFEYTRQVTMTADISSLAQRGKRTTFESYDPADDFVEFDVTLRSTRPLKIGNNLVEAELVLDREGLLLAGTNQRFGLRGTVKIKQGRIRLRQSEFEVRQGHVRFDDLTRIAPQVDVTAVTEYRRYTEAAAEAGTPQSTSSSSSTNVSGGRWHITMHAYGDADKLRIDLTSEPALAQDDIFLLLTVGLTRAELDQAQSASVGESVALEALGTLTGADRAVKSAVPVIDEFRFGSAYSSRTGRTEPTVTIGKRLAERIRANVTSGLADSREVRSNLEWRLSPRVSVEGSYDNVNDISSSSLGNLGADIRWRLEFE